MKPGKRNTKVECEWQYNGYALRCQKELTPAEIEFCKEHVKELAGLSLCYGHQGQYKRMRENTKV